MRPSNGCTAAAAASTTYAFPAYRRYGGRLKNESIPQPARHKSAIATYSRQTRRVNTRGFFAGARRSITARIADAATNATSIIQPATDALRDSSAMNSARKIGRYQLRIAPPSPTTTDRFSSLSRLRLSHRRYPGSW